MASTSVPEFLSAVKECYTVKAGTVRQMPLRRKLAESVQACPSDAAGNSVVPSRAWLMRKGVILAVAVFMPTGSLWAVCGGGLDVRSDVCI